MASVTKYTPISNNPFEDLKTHFCRRRRGVAVAAYSFAFVFIAFTVFLAFAPSPNSSSPWFTNIFTLSSSSSSTNSSSSTIFSDESYRSHFSSLFSYFFPNSTSSAAQTHETRSQNTVFEQPSFDKGSSNVKNQTKNEDPYNKVEVLKPDNSSINSKDSSMAKNQTQSMELNGKGEVLKKNETQSTDLNGKGEVLKKNETQSKDLKLNQSKNGVTESANSNKSSSEGNGEKVIGEKGVLKNFSSSLMKKQSESDELINALSKCDMFDGNWVRADSYPLYKPGSCSLIDEQFDCFLNGRPDNDYFKMKWKPKGCSLPRLNGSHMLEMLKGKRLVFVGDSLNRNMWESLICILKNAAKNPNKVYEESGRHHFRNEASYSFIFEDYKCTVEFFVSPFLVREWEVVDKNGTKKETLRLDLVERSADKYKHADIIVFNTGHWWTHEKTSKGQDYYQEGSNVYKELDVLEAFRKALTTWGRWIDANVNPSKSLIFFRGYSASHFSGGQWNSGGACDHETEPIKNETYIRQYPPKMTVLEKVLRNMKTRVTYLNITSMTDFRKDGHPSIYRVRKQSLSGLSDEERRAPLRFQDCSHWCLPGVPDAWNEILYAQLLVKLNKQQQRP